MKFLIKYATRGRPEKFFQAIQNIYDTIGTDNYLIVVSMDSDDETMTNPQVRERLRNLKNAIVYVGSPTGKIGAINRDMDKIKDWDVLVNFSDDMKFVQPGWDIVILDKIHTEWGGSLDFFAHFNDGFVGDKLPTMTIIGREYYERFFYIYPPCYKSVSCDAEAMFVAMMLNKHKYFPEILFKHEHAVNIRIPYDKTYLQNEQYNKEDYDTFHKRLNKYFYVNRPEVVPFNTTSN